MASSKFDAVYTALSQDNFNMALRHAERKDIANTMLAKALKAYALHRLGGRQEAAAVAMEVAASKPSDLAVLNPLLAVIKASGEDEVVSRLLENAISAAAGNPAAGASLEELHRQLALAQLRGGDFKKLQATAMKLARGVGPSPSGNAEYTCWIALAINLLVNRDGHAAVPGMGSAEAGYPAPHAVTGGGRRVGLSRAPAGDAVAAGSLQVAATLMERLLDKLSPAERDTEKLGLWIHSLVRLGRAKEAYEAITSGKYAGGTGGEGEVTTPSPAPVADASKPADLASSISFEEDVYAFADGKEGRGLSPGTMEPVDKARMAAYLLTEACDWAAARDAYSTLLTTIDADDWAYHTGLAYCEAQLLVVSLSSSLEGAASEEEKATAAVSCLQPLVLEAGSSTGTAASGAAGADSLLKSAYAAAVAATTSAPAGSPPSTVVPRGPLLSLLQLAAVRLEVAARLPPAIAAAPTVAAAIAATTTQFVALLQLYIRAVGHKACCFGDVSGFLHTLLPGAAAAAPAGVSVNSGLGGFLGGCPELPLQILALPFTPLAPAGSASDAAHADPPFRWSFCVATAAAPLLDSLTATAAATRPDEGLQTELTALVAAARDAALEAEAAADAAEKEKRAAAAAAAAAAKKAAGKGGAKKGGSGGGSGAAAAAAAADMDGLVDDPHGVQAALSPARALAFTPEQEARKEAIRARIRIYTTAHQLLRYLGATSMPRASVHANGDADAAAARIRAAVQELTAAWACTLPLGTASVGGQREVQEGDDLLLLAVHGLWDLAFAAAASLSVETAAGGEPDAALAAARGFLLESLTLLEAGRVASEYNAQLRLALVRVCAWLGAPGAASQHQTALRVKSLLLDTLGTPLITGAHRFGGGAAVDAMCDSLLKLHRWSAREAPDYVCTAVRAGNYSQALDIVRMMGRMQGSATAALVRSVLAATTAAGARHLNEARELLHRLLGGAAMADGGDAWSGAGVDVRPETLAALRDNDDRDVYASWDAPSPPLLTELRWGAAAAVGPAVVGAAVAPAAGSPIATSLAASLASSPCPPTPEVLAACVTGSRGGTWERALRRVARDTTFLVRISSLTACWQTLEGRLEPARAALAQLKAALGPWLGEGAPAAGAVAWAAADATSACLPVIDTGLGRERVAVRVAAAKALVAAVSALVASPAAAATEPGALAAALQEAEANCGALSALLAPGAASAAALAEAALCVHHYGPCIAIAAAGVTRNAAAEAKPFAAAVQALFEAAGRVAAGASTALAGDYRKAEGSVLGGFSAEACVTDLARGLWSSRPVPVAPGAKKGGAKPKPAADATVYASKGAEYAAKAAKETATAFAEALEGAVEGLCTALADVSKRLKAEADARVAFITRK